MESPRNSSYCCTNKSYDPLFSLRSRSITVPITLITAISTESNQLHLSTRSELANIKLGCLLLQTLSKWTASIMTVPPSAQQIAQLYPWYMMVGVPPLSLYSIRFREATFKEESLKKGVGHIQGSKFVLPSQGPQIENSSLPCISFSTPSTPAVLQRKTLITVFPPLPRISTKITTGKRCT